MRWVKIRAAGLGKADSAVIEESLRRDLGIERRSWMGRSSSRTGRSGGRSWRS
jgi:hypothetical protein